MLLTRTIKSRCKWFKAYG